MHVSLIVALCVLAAESDPETPALASQWDMGIQVSELKHMSMFHPYLFISIKYLATVHITVRSRHGKFVSGQDADLISSLLSSSTQTDFSHYWNVKPSAVAHADWSDSLQAIYQTSLSSIRARKTLALKNLPCQLPWRHGVGPSPLHDCPLSSVHHRPPSPTQRSGPAALLLLRSAFLPRGRDHQETLGRPRCRPERRHIHIRFSSMESSSKLNKTRQICLCNCLGRRHSV